MIFFYLVPRLKMSRNIFTTEMGKSNYERSERLFNEQLPTLVFREDVRQNLKHGPEHELRKAASAADTFGTTFIIWNWDIDRTVQTRCTVAAARKEIDAEKA
jgi:hypothetical protein